MERVLIKNLEENDLSKISGMIKTIRNTKYMIFIKLKVFQILYQNLNEQHYHIFLN